MKSENKHKEQTFEEKIARQCKRMRLARNTEEKSLWAYLGLLGMVGWSIVLPMVLGAFLGRWVDLSVGGGYQWTLGCLLLGLGMGCFNAWRTINQEE